VPGRDVDTALRIVHDLTQSVWLGGALMGATVLDDAASSAGDDAARIAGIDRAWSRWHRISTPAIAAHLIAGVGLSLANRGRLSAQAGATRTMVARTALTGVALATEAASRRIGRHIGEHTGGSGTPEGDPGQQVERLQRQLTVAQWSNVAAVATMIAVGSRMGEQQRPRELARGIARRLHLAA
jgi:xanthine/uracil permease